AVHRRRAVRCRYHSQDHRRTGRRAEFGARESRDRSRPGRFDGNQEARRVFLMSTLADAPFDIEEFLAAEQSKDLLRLTTAGSVDDGKSTLIGRMLHDAKGAYEDQLKSARRGGAIDFSLL